LGHRINPDAQAKFVHTVSAGYVTGAMFVLSISSWYLLKGRDVEFAKRSFRVASAFGLASVLSVIVLGDESGYTVGEAQQTKMAAIEAMWDTEPAPAGLKLIAGINEAQSKNDWELEIPWLMGLIGTRSVTKQIPGIHEIKARNRERIVNGIRAVAALEALRKNRGDDTAKQVLEATKGDLGFGLLLKKYTTDVTQATPAMIDQAMHDTVPKVTPMFWSFRLMVGLGFAMLALFGLAFWSTLKGACRKHRWLLRWAVLMLPAPWIACELGWVGGIRPPTLDHLWRVTHSPQCFHAQRREPVRLLGWLHRVLHDPVVRRDVPDGQVCSTGTGQPRHRPI
jgi:cytochrome d ubiquinol oxidase subunit I